jgi:molybdopterin molybdotransferase
VVGLPGNPGAAFISARLFLAPLIALMSGGRMSDSLPWRTARVLAPLACCDDRTAFLFARRSAGGVEPLAEQDSSFQSTLARADVVIRREPGASALAAGATVSVLSLD